MAGLKYNLWYTAPIKSVSYINRVSFKTETMLRRSAQTLLPRFGGQLAAGFQSGSFGEAITAICRDEDTTKSYSFGRFDLSKRCTFYEKG